MGDEVPLSEVCACYARLPGDESGMVVCWVCEMTVVQVFDDGIGPELVRSCMRLVRDQEEEERAAMTVVRNQEEETFWWMFWRRSAVIGSFMFAGTAAAEGKWVAFALAAVIGVWQLGELEQDNCERKAVG